MIPFCFFVLCINVILNLILIDKMGTIGAAIASAISFSLLIPFTYYYTRKYLNSEQTYSS
jgi:O-antigen/teichoic acid export membrane protein